MNSRFLIGMLFLCNILGLGLSIIWYLREKDLEPVITGLASLGSIAALGIDQSKYFKKPQVVMKQKAGKKSIQLQAGKDIHFNRDKK